MSDCWRGRTAHATGTWVGWDRCSRRAAHAGLTIRPARTKAIIHRQVARKRMVVVIMARINVGALPRYFKLWALSYYNTMEDTPTIARAGMAERRWRNGRAMERRPSPSADSSLAPPYKPASPWYTRTEVLSAHGR